VFAVFREKSLGSALFEKARAQFGPHLWLALTETL